MRHALIAFALLTLAASAHAAQPGILVSYDEGYVRVALEGSYAGAQYVVYRSDGAAATFAPMSSEQTLCTGECYALDLRADAGRTYEYRFDLYWPDGSIASFGPYAVTVPNPPLGVVVRPSPLRSFPGAIDLTLPGTRTRDPEAFADLRVLDARGRTVRILSNGMNLRGTTHYSWDGRDAAGRTMPAGMYFVRVTSSLGNTTQKFVKL